MQQYLIHKLLSLWFLIGISLTFGYEASAQTNVTTPIELVQRYTTDNSKSTVSYIHISKVYNASFATSWYTSFSFVQFMHTQDRAIQRTYILQEEIILTTSYTCLTKRLALLSPLFDDTVNSHFLS